MKTIQGSNYSITFFIKRFPKNSTTSIEQRYSDVSYCFMRLSSTANSRVVHLSTEIPRNTVPCYHIRCQHDRCLLWHTRDGYRHSYIRISHIKIEAISAFSSRLDCIYSALLLSRHGHPNVRRMQ